MDELRRSAGVSTLQRVDNQTIRKLVNTREAQLGGKAKTTTGMSRR